jgi:hypothetical protein
MAKRWAAKNGLRVSFFAVNLFAIGFHVSHQAGPETRSASGLTFRSDYAASLRQLPRDRVWLHTLRKGRSLILLMA